MNKNSQYKVLQLHEIKKKESEEDFHFDNSEHAAQFRTETKISKNLGHNMNELSNELTLIQANTD